MITDPVEQTIEYKQIENELEKLIDERLKNFPRSLGYCHMYWGVKKSILRDKYNIDWHSPAELNPNILFD